MVRHMNGGSNIIHTAVNMDAFELQPAAGKEGGVQRNEISKPLLLLVTQDSARDR